MTIYCLDREERSMFRIYYRAHGRMYALVNNGGYGRKDLAFYRCSTAGQLLEMLSFVPMPCEFNRYVEP